ncbi:hypothetical protein WG66_001731 [Moniliophthora roreri]|nr:hypothetical protein WG66_001731 [Moniliophthora roreri]
MGVYRCSPLEITRDVEEENDFGVVGARFYERSTDEGLNTTCFYINAVQYFHKDRKLGFGNLRRQFLWN